MEQHKTKHWPILLSFIMFLGLFASSTEPSIVLDTSFAVASSWGTGYTGNITLKNTSTYPVTSWNVNFSLPQNHSFDSLWNGKPSISGQTVMVINEEWNGTLQPNQTVVIGFTVNNPSKTTPTVMNLSAIGNTQESTNTQQNNEPSFTLTAHSMIDNSWGSGYQVTVIIKNNGTEPTSAWNVSFMLPDAQAIESLWNGVHYANGQSHLISNPTWGGVIPAGGTTSFGMVINMNGSTNQLLNLQATANQTTSNENPTMDPEPTPIPETPMFNQISATSPRDYMVSWQSVQHATSYKLEQSTMSDFSQPQTIVNAAILSYQFTNQPNGIYYYRISASNSSGMSSYSTPQMIQINVDPATELTAPALNPISNNDNSGNYTISWGSVENALEYILEESATSNFGQASTMFMGTALSYNVMNKAPGTYYYRVKAKSGMHASPASTIQMTRVYDPSTGQKDYKIIGYFPNWGMYRHNPFRPEHIDASLVTHINYAFVNHDEAGNLILFDPWADVQYGENWTTPKPYWGHFRQLYDLKQRFPHLKTLFSVGGWTLSKKFSPMAANPQARAHFVEECIKFCEKYDFDGVDIDWEYPRYAEHNGHQEDMVNFTLLLQELHVAAKAHSPQLLVTIAAPAGPWHYENVEVSKIHQYLDWINLMCYDFYGAGWSSMTNHNAPLYSPAQEDAPVNSNAAVQYYLSQGVPKDKLIMGMPIYGRSFGNVQSTTDGLFAPYDGPGKGSTEPEPGMRFYFDIKNNLLPIYTRYWDDQAKVPYLYNPNLKEFVGYDDEESLAIKCNYVKQQGLAGAMVWELGLDTWPIWDCMKVINNTLHN